MTATITVLADYKRRRLIVRDTLTPWAVGLAFLPTLAVLTWWGTYYRTFADVVRIK